MFQEIKIGTVLAGQVDNKDYIEISIFGADLICLQLVFNESSLFISFYKQNNSCIDKQDINDDSKSTFNQTRFEDLYLKLKLFNRKPTRLNEDKETLKTYELRFIDLVDF